MKSSDGYLLARNDGDPDVYIPLLIEGDHEKDFTATFGENYALHFNALAVNYK